MIKVSAIGHATFETPDLERMLDYYQHVLGLLLIDRGPADASLASTLDDQSVVLKHGSVARCSTLALQVPKETDLRDAAKHLIAHGVRANVETDITSSTPIRVTFDGPEDVCIALIHERPGSNKAPAADGISPRKLGHVAFNVHDVQKTVKFFVDHLGFRESDWMADFFAFLRCGSDHHTLNFLHGQKNKMHHIAFEARDWNHIKDACDFLGKQKIPLIWGPGRHGVGHNLFIYHHTPDGQIMELYAELDQMTDEASGAFDPRPWHEDNPQRPKIWKPGPQASNIWGIPTPQLMRD